jgi:hypothetical protein
MLDTVLRQPPARDKTYTFNNKQGEAMPKKEHIFTPQPLPTPLEVLVSI